MVVDWARAEGWNPGVHDAETFFATDPDGFYLGLLNHEPIASISVVHYGPDYSFVGYFIVKPEQRGKKYGLRLWLHAMDRLNATSSGLDGVLAQTDNYARSGFETAYHNQRYRGALRSSGATDRRVVPFQASELEAVCNYDRALFPAAREPFLERWLSQPDTHALVLKDGGRIAGYGVLRPSEDGYRIGPLFADDAGGAEALLDAFAERVPADSIISIDVPEPNEAARELVSKREMLSVFETARMYRGPEPQVDVSRMFGVTCLELG